ncbi:MAG: phosphotransferase [Planctomycetes bacterium]|nr:phosphotransferase [Planctomycetota bacterium]
MSRSATSPFAALLATLPHEPRAELILAEDRDRRPTVLMRVDGEPPRAFVGTPAGTGELLPAADDALPGADLLRDPMALTRALAPIGEVRSSRLVAWRPGRRAVLRVGLGNGDVVWLKLLDDKGWRRAMRAFAAIGAAPAPLRLCTPTLSLDEHCAYIVAPAAGVPLHRLLVAGEMPPLTIVSRAAMALAFTPVHAELPVLDFAAARDAATRMLGKAAAVRPELTAIADRLAGLPAPAPIEPCLVHGDLHDKQLFLADAGAALIDLDGMALGDPRFDIANLTEHVRLRDLQYRGDDGGLADVLLARCNLDPDSAAARSFRILVRARLCGVYALRPRWTALAERLRHEVDTLLENPQ